MRLLVDGRRTASRHRSLVAALDWSYDLLDEPARTLLRRLAVFTGPFALDLVERICTDEGAPATPVIDVIGHLVDASMVVYDRSTRWARYRLLETVRVYAADRLEEAGETQIMRARHAQGYLVWLESEPWGAGVFVEDLVAAQVEELGNLRHALTWLRTSGDRVLVGRLAARMDRLWSPAVGLGAEGREWLDWALEDEAALTPTTRAGCWTTRSVASTTLGSAEQEDDGDPRTRSRQRSQATGRTRGLHRAVHRRVHVRRVRQRFYEGHVRGSLHPRRHRVPLVGGDRRPDDRRRDRHRRRDRQIVEVSWEVEVPPEAHDCSL